MNFLHAIQHTSADYLGLMEDHLEGRRIRSIAFEVQVETTGADVAPVGRDRTLSILRSKSQKPNAALEAVP